MYVRGRTSLSGLNVGGEGGKMEDRRWRSQSLEGAD